MKDIELRDLQLKSMEVLKEFKNFCDKHGLLFYFCGGCCIGTVRHKGFIPWDDDIDVFMPRDDYERFKKEWQDTERFKLIYTTKDCFTRFLVMYLSDETTTFIKGNQKDLDISHGIRVEIIPIDGCPNSRIKRRIQVLWALTYQLFINKEAFSSKGKIVKFITTLMLIMVPTWNLKYKLAKHAEKKMTKYRISECDKITELTTRFQYMLNEYPKEIFASAVYKEFEGEMMPIPVGYDTYLKMAFGDYMQLPPKDKQIPKHEAVKVDVNNSYKKYKGKYYCVK